MDIHEMIEDGGMIVSVEPGIKTYTIEIPSEKFYSSYFVGQIRATVDGTLINSANTIWIGSLETQVNIDYNDFVAPAIRLLPNSLSIEYIDIDGNSIFDYIQISVNVQADVSGHVDIWIEMRSADGNWIDSGGYGNHVELGKTTMKAVVGSTGLYESKYNGLAEFHISGHVNPDDGGDWPLGMLKRSKTVDYANFEPPRITIVPESMEVTFKDEDTDGLYELVVVKIQVEVKKAVKISVYVNVDNQDSWGHIAHGDFEGILEPGTQTIRVKIAGESFYLSEHQGKVSFNMHGDEIYDEGSVDNEDDDIRFRLHDQHKADITIDYTTFKVPDVIIDKTSITVKYMQAVLNLNQQAYDFARVTFDLKMNQTANFDFWVDVFVGENRQWITSSSYYGTHDLEVGKSSLDIDINGRDLSTIGQEEKITFGLSGWVQISDQLEYDYPEIQITPDLNPSDFNPEGESPVNKEHQHDHEGQGGENGETSSTPSIPIGNYLMAILSLISIVYLHKKRI
jgi:hypothetical protein